MIGLKISLTLHILEPLNEYIGKARIFLLVDLQDFFSDLGLGGTKNKKL